MIRFDTDRHDKLLTTMDTILTEIGTQLDHLNDAAAKLRSQWDGAARDAYDTAQHQWQNAMNALHTILRTANTANRHTGETLTKTDTTAEHLWS